MLDFVGGPGYVEDLGNGHSVMVMIPELIDLEANLDAPIPERFSELAQALQVPPAYLLADNAPMAEAILALGQANELQQAQFAQLMQALSVDPAFAKPLLKALALPKRERDRIRKALIAALRDTDALLVAALAETFAAISRGTTDGVVEASRIADRRFEENVRLVLAVGLLGALVSVALAALLGRRILHRLGGDLEPVVADTRRVAEGDLTQTLQSGKAAANSLVASIEGMRSRLRVLIAEVKGRRAHVEQRPGAAPFSARSGQRDDAAERFGNTDFRSHPGADDGHRGDGGKRRQHGRCDASCAANGRRERRSHSPSDQRAAQHFGTGGSIVAIDARPQASRTGHHPLRARDQGNFRADQPACPER